MMEFIGLILFGSAFALLAVLTPWFRRHEGVAYVEAFMLGELAAITITALLIAGGALLANQIIQAAIGNDTVHLVISIGALAIGLPALLFARRWLIRVLARRWPGPTQEAA